MSDYWHYPRPTLARSYVDQAQVGLRTQTLFAARGIGKTRFVLQDLLPAAHEAGYLPIYCDLWSDDEQPAKALIRALEQARSGNDSGVRKLRPAGLRKLAGSLDVLGVKIEGEAGFDRNVAPPARDVDAFHDAVDGLLAQTKTPVWLVLDEAQALADTRHASFVKAMRAEFQRHDERLVRVFTGSSRAGLDRLFHRKKAALFEQGGPRQPFPALGRGFIEHIAQRFHAHTRGAELGLEAAWDAFERLGRSARLFRAALDRVLIAESPDISSACQAVLETGRIDHEFVAHWEAMPPIDQAVFLRVMQSGERMFSVPVRGLLANWLGRAGVESWEVQAALDRLENAHLIYRGDRGVYAVENDEFRVWLENQLERELG